MFYISEKTSIVWFSIFTSNTAKVDYILPPCIWKPQTEALVSYIWVSLLAYTAIGTIYIRTKFLWEKPPWKPMVLFSGMRKKHLRLLVK